MENQTSKYFKYAIGEIILVMIGILLALQVNNWNEARKTSNAESQALVELLVEFKTNYKDLLRVERSKLTADKEIRSYLEFLHNDTIPENEKYYVRVRLGITTWDMAYKVLEGLISSGAINNIKNDSLRTLLNNWESITKNYLGWEQNYSQDRVKGFTDYLIEKVPSYIIPPDSTFTKYGRHYYESEKEIQQYAKQIVFDMKYQNLLKQLSRGLYIQLNGIQLVKQNHNKIVALLEEEIKNNK